MAHFLIINTGGTIGMSPGPRGLTPDAAALTRAFNEHPELVGWQQHQLTWKHWDPLLDSSDLQPNHWFHLRNDILNYSDVDATLIIHGTDTLAYTAAALSFLLNDSNQPVVITGSMLPIADPDSDAIANLQSALDALQAQKSEVVVAVGQHLLPGSRLTKASTETADAFKAPGWPVNWSDLPELSPISFNTTYRQTNIEVLTLFPGVRFPDAASLKADPPQAVLINAYGNGNAPDCDASRDYLRALQQLDIPVFVRSQCFEGNVSFGQYAASALFADYGAVSCGTMSFEAALTKLQLLCSESDDSSWVKETFQRPLAREWQ